MTGKKEYLNAATIIFNDMLGTGGNATCGGIWWNKAKPQHMTSIANELFVSIGAHLANRVTNGAYYYEWAEKIWTWFSTGGLVGANNLVRDSLDDTCKVQGGTWTYNQGVILGALVEMNEYRANSDLIAKANAIATATMATLADKNGILHESYDNNTAKYPFPVGHDGQSFKGVFMRNLARLQLHTGRADQKLFITRNADSVWDNARYPNGTIGVNWAGPLNGVVDVPQQVAGLDALVAAYAVAGNEAPASSVQAGIKTSTKPETSSPATIKSASTTTREPSRTPTKSAGLPSVKNTDETSTKSPSKTSEEITSKSIAKNTSKTTATESSKTSAKSSAKATASAPGAPETSTTANLDGLDLVICPIGDSITFGFQSSGGNGYRGPLRAMLEQAGANVTMVGTRRSGTMIEPYHEGWSGSGIPGIRGNVTKDGALTKYKPNVVLLHAGTNDMIPGHDPVYDPAEAHVWLESFMEYIYEEVPGVTIVVAQIIEPLQQPGRLNRTLAYNAEIVELVKKMGSNGSKVFLANDGPWLTTQNTTMYADNLHPNSKGYQVMAEGWFKGLTHLAEAHRDWIIGTGSKSTSTSSKTSAATHAATFRATTSTHATLKTSFVSKESSSLKKSDSVEGSTSHKVSFSSETSPHPSMSHIASHSSHQSTSETISSPMVSVSAEGLSSPTSTSTHTSTIVHTSTVLEKPSFETSTSTHTSTVVHRSTVLDKPSSKASISPLTSTHTSTNVHTSTILERPSSKASTHLSTSTNTSTVVHTVTIVETPSSKISLTHTLTNTHTSTVTHTATVVQEPSISHESSTHKSATSEHVESSIEKHSSSSKTIKSTKTSTVAPASHVTTKPSETPVPTISHPQYSFTRPPGFPVQYTGYGVWKRWIGDDDEILDVED